MRNILHKIRLCYLIMLICILSSYSTKSQSIDFNHLLVEDGLSQSTVFSIYKDRKGFMWFGTRRGLNWYDGYEFKHFMCDANDPNSLSSNQIYEIIGDKQDNLIIRTDSDINYYNRYTEKFSVIPNVSLQNMINDWENNVWGCSGSGIYLFNDQKLAFENVADEYPFTDLHDLSLDKNNNIWLTSSHGVIRYNPVNQEYKLYEIAIYSGQETDNYFIETDSNGKIWICSRNGGVLYYSAYEDAFIRLELSIKQGNLVSSFGRGLDNTIIIGTDGNGIIMIDISTNKYESFNHIPDEPASLSSNTIYSIFADNKLGILWLGSYMGGIDYYCQYDKGFKFILREPYNQRSIINNNIRSLLVDKMNHIWIGTRQGISALDSGNNVIMEFSQNTLSDAGITNPIITNLWQDSLGFIWICSYKGGVILYNPSTSTFTEVSEVYPNVSIPAGIGIFDVMMDSKKNIWIASDMGTYLFPFNKKGFVFDENFSKTLIEDRAGRIFIGLAYNGLLLVNNALQISQITFDTLNMSDRIRRINTLVEDTEGEIWIGTGGEGIIKYNPITNKIQLFTTDNGLPDNNIAGIIEDNNRIIWTTTYSGIGRYSSDNNRFKNVSLGKDIKGKEFNPNSIVITANNDIYAGSINGLLTFRANMYRENPFLPDVIFTELHINNEKVTVCQKGSPIDQAVMFADRIALKYFQKSVVLKFTAPEYFHGAKVKFYYKFGKGNGTWNYLGNNRSLNLVDLQPGDYILTVKAENSDGYSKTDGTGLLIHVDPPPWKTIYAYIIYAIVIVCLLLLSRHIIKTRLKLKYQIFLYKAEKEKQTEINQARSKIFVDVSHEIGNYLTLMNVPLETLNRIEVDDIKKRYLAIISNNVQKLILLVKRIIDIRKIETGNMTLLAGQDDIVGFVKAVCVNFEAVARRKNINFIQDLPVDGITTWFDKEKIEYILFNLLSNAFKFEPENGIVLISLIKKTGIINGNNKKLIQIRVNNKGSVIADDKAKNIFKRFYKGSENSFGSGIGLSLTKSYVEIHKGEIDFVSGSLEGVTFDVKIPYGEAYLAPNEKNVGASKYDIKIPQYLEPENETVFFVPEPGNDERNKILIVEDNIELQKLFKEQFCVEYDIIEAKDAEEGFMKTKSFQPDIVITDRMSNGGGVELCSAIKKDFDTDHIPVIILTSNDEIEERIKGMEAGADAYITKPFSVYYLVSVIRNLIDLRSKLRKRYRLGARTDDDQINITSMDENFLEKAYAILEKNLENLQFGIPEFMEQLGISKYMLYSKIKMLTGQTPNDFIVVYKLRKAANILKNKDISDLDLYYKLGFNDVSYFRKCFKKYYGMTPSQFVKSNKFIKGESHSK